MVYSHSKIIEFNINRLIDRSLPEGGFSLSDRDLSSPDATAWAAIALSAIMGRNEYSINACHYLSNKQKADGRISLVDEVPEACWPTFSAILAWQKIGKFEIPNKKALSFLLNYTGKHWTKTRKQAKIVGHDTSILGWPWIEKTHSWVEPTSMAIMALKSNHMSHHDRVLEGIQMLIDRQLPSGGWNYGNTSVFGQQLLAMPDFTGIALCALEGSVTVDAVKKSVAYAAEQVRKIRTPRSLVWCLFGLCAWSKKNYDYKEMIYESLDLQKKYGAYDTVQLSQLLLAYFVKTELLNFFYGD
jgi:hypothetical protein